MNTGEGEKGLKITMSKEVAVSEFKEFLKDHIFSELEDKDILDKYPQVITALTEGNLVLSEEPEYTLRNPVETKSGVVDLIKVTFRTRISVSEKTKLSKGIDMREEPLKYSFASMAFIMKLQTVAYLDKFSKFDLKVCEQLSTVFV